jgi:hypothetical protein
MPQHVARFLQRLQQAMRRALVERRRGRQLRPGSSAAAQPPGAPQGQASGQGAAAFAAIGRFGPAGVNASLEGVLAMVLLKQIVLLSCQYLSMIENIRSFQ